ncbi:zinc-alpha-2-glycoprotein-like isoform X2 [Ornithorhynchus anatinus]|uniref:zinc-alpha-2-glycoprotein-like isoform X2 n=1 Tax=Ornithorhynchus anatinus TaxID=9258 RepID=UPI0010A92047|nr:zinc-alpha-2-glycoprotein-like isoform X2 [Ornithorhynchus anatinus]
MEAQRRLGCLTSFFWLLLGSPSLPQAPEDHHIGAMYLTAVRGDDSFFELTAVIMLDGQQMASYNSTDRKLVLNVNWLYQVVGRKLIQEKKADLEGSERDFRWGMENWAWYHNHSRGTQMVQQILACELNRGVQVVSRFRFAYQGQEVLWLDELKGTWEATGPAKKQFGHFLEERVYWFQEAERFVREECPFLMKMVLPFWHLRVPTPPEVTVTRHDAKDGSVIFTCLATGFYPSSILLRWVKDGEVGLWGDESSSGTLPNADSSFYVRQTLEVRGEAADTGYACVVEHTTLDVPVFYPAPEKPSWLMPRDQALGVGAAAVLVLSPAVGVILWKKKKTDSGEQIAVSEQEMTSLDCPEVCPQEPTNPGVSLSPDPSTEAGVSSAT